MKLVRQITASQETYIKYFKVVNHITIREKIRLIRTFRNMTQKVLDVAIGFDEKGANNQIAQYETNYRVPKMDMLYKIAEALKVNSLNFVSEVPGSTEDIMQAFLGLDKDNRNTINLFQVTPFVNNDDKDINDTTVCTKSVIIG